MKQLKSFLKILVILLLVTQNSFASVKPISGIGIVVKSQGSGSAEVMQTGDNGGFSMQLEAGEYELSFPQDQLKFEINSIIARNYPKSIYRYDGSGVELTINNPEITLGLKPAEGNIFTIEAQNSSIIITVPRDGTILSGILGWNDAIMKNSISCPDGFVMQNGKCVPKIKGVSQNKGIEKKDIRRNVTENSSDKTERKGWNGTIKGNSKKTENTSEETQKMAIKEQGVKKSGVENVGNDTEVMPEAMANQNSVNNINGGMPNRISMNVTVPKQTQGATFGEKVNSGKINVTLVEGGCVVLFPSDEGYRVNTTDKSIQELSTNESIAFGERVNQGLHSAGGALAQGTSLLGGSLPGGAVISASVSSVGNLAGGASGDEAKGKISKTDSEKKIWEINDKDVDVLLALPDGDYEMVFVIVEKATSGLKDTLKTQVRIGFAIENNVIKKKGYVGHITLMK
ncbi:MAG TPA: hypothetical protein VLM44_08260 [Lutibacter sp.]|nr:hypothetical protein [Lutibacter sp.]